MTKSEVEIQQLGDYVIMPSGVELCFQAWWRSTDPSTVVSVKYPHGMHGNALKPSNSAIKSCDGGILTIC